MKYRWKSWGNSRVKAEIVGKVIETLHDKHQGVTPELLVDEARKKRSPVHNLFEWDDTTAAKAYRVHQARLVLNHIEVVIEREGEQPPLCIRAFHNVITDEERRVYTTVASARNNEALWNQITQEALRQIKNWQETYRDIQEFEVIFAAIDQIA